MLARLRTPDKSLEKSYRGLLAEFLAAGEKLIPFPLGYACDDFGAMLSRLERDSKGIDLPGGFVPSSTRWLVTDAGEVVGVSNLRHRLNPALLLHGGHIGYAIRPSTRRKGLGREILGQTLAFARQLGLGRVLVTCAKQNAGSARIIVANGGALHSEEFIPERGEIVQRYWIDLGVEA